MKKALVLLAFSLLSFAAYSQVVGIKSNLLYDATTSMNLGVEVALAPKLTLDISGNYNPWEFNNKQFKHWLVQPELRYWLCEKFNGSFFGIHAHYAEFNAKGIKLPFDLYPGLKDHRYQGKLYGAGVSYVYHWILKKRWSMEATVGVGYARVDYDRYNCQDCGTKLNSGHKNYFGPTKLGLSLIYIIK